MAGASIEAILAAILAIVLGTAPMTMGLKIVLLVVLFGLVIHLIWKGPWFSRASRWMRFLICVLALVLVLLIYREFLAALYFNVAAWHDGIAFWGIAGFALGILMKPSIDAFTHIKTTFRLPVKEATRSDLEYFFVTSVVPACDSQVSFHKSVVRHFCADDHVAELAISGLDEKRMRLNGWRKYEVLADRLGASPAGDVRYDELIACICALENSDYRKFRLSIEALLDRNGASIDFHKYAELRRIRDGAAEKHKELVASYNNIKADRRFKPLYRPSRASRW